MMDSQLEIKLIECLGLLDAGEPIERILARFPEDAARLRPLLETAGLLPSLHREPTEQARTASRRTFLNQAAAQRERAARRWLWFPPRTALSLASVLIVFVLLGGVSAAAQRALPDSALYPVKRAIEGARLLLAQQGQQATLSAGFDQRRRDEIGALLANKRTADVEFEGQIEALSAGRWQISGVPVQITPATDIAGTPRIGARAQVQGRTADGQLLASIITVEAGGPPPTATATATPSPTAMPSATPVPSATATAAPTAMPRPTSLPEDGTAGRPNSTAVPSARPTSPPAAPPTEQPATPTAAPPPTATPLPPTQPPAETELEFEGVVESIGGTAWQISGQLVALDGATEIRGPINVGDTVRVRARRLADGQLIARRIERRDDNNNGDSSGGSDDHGGGGSGSDDNSGGSDDHGGGGGSGGSDDKSGGSDDHGGGSGGGSGDKKQ